MIIGWILSLVLSTISGISFILGAVLAGAGIFLMASKDKVREMINLVDSSALPSVAKDAADSGKEKAQELVDKFDIISTVGLAVLIIGCFIAGVAICGGIGSMCKLKILLLVYIIVTGVMFIALMIGVIYFGTLKARLNEKIMDKLTTLKDDYFVSLITVLKQPDNAKSIMTITFNAMQIGLKCCGVKVVGDVRNGTSWLESERRITELNNMMEGKSGGKNMSDEVSLPMGSMADDSAQKVPDWLKDKMPANHTQLPKGVAVPANLPKEFVLPPDFKDKLAELAKSGNFTKDGLTNLFSATLTIQTPLTCCKLKKTTGLMSGKFDVKEITEMMENPSCPFSANNDAVNDKPCYDAMLDYIYSYQKLVVSVGTGLAIVVGVGLGCALWIFLFE